MIAAPVFAFGLVAFGFLGMGPVTIAVDSYGPVTDNAQSVYELSLIEQVPNVKSELKRDFGFDVNFDRAKDLLEANDGAGNTFKASAKPVLIGTAVVGSTTMIFSIIMALTNRLSENIDKLSLLHAPFLLGLITGGAMIYWFTGASMQAVTTGAYRAVEYIKANIKLEGAEKASVEDSKNVVEICTQYAQKGMFNIFLAVFFGTLAFAFTEPFFFIGYLISIAIFGLYQAIFMANAGGAWDNAKKVVEVELKAKGTALHDACVVGDTVGDPFKDTSSVAMNPVIKFTTLFGLLAVELAVSLTGHSAVLTHVLAAVFLLISMSFVYRSFYGMRIGTITARRPPSKVLPTKQFANMQNAARKGGVFLYLENWGRRLPTLCVWRPQHLWYSLPHGSVALTRQLVDIESTTGNEAAVVEFLGNYLSSTGLDGRAHAGRAPPFQSVCPLAGRSLACRRVFNAHRLCAAFHPLQRGRDAHFRTRCVRRQGHSCRPGCGRTTPAR